MFEGSGLAQSCAVSPVDLMVKSAVSPVFVTVGTVLESCTEYSGEDCIESSVCKGSRPVQSHAVSPVSTVVRIAVSPVGTGSTVVGTAVSPVFVRVQDQFRDVQ